MAATVLATTVLGGAVLAGVAGCSSGHGSGYSVAALQRSLLTRAEAALPGYTLGHSDGESHAGTTFANEFFDDTRNQAQVDVSLLTAATPAAASRASAYQVEVAGAALRSGGTRAPLLIGTGGVRYTGREKVGGALESSVFFTVGRVSAQVVFVGIHPSLPLSEVERLARLQAAKLRAAA